MKISQFFSVQSMFEINRVIIEPADKALVFVGLVLVVLAVLFKISELYAPSPVDRKYRGKFFSLFAWIGFSELVWYAARVEFIRFFGTRFVALLILLIGLAWFVPLLVKTLRRYSGEKQQWEKDQVKQKYLPKQA